MQEEKTKDLLTGMCNRQRKKRNKKKYRAARGARKLCSMTCSEYKGPRKRKRKEKVGKRENADEKEKKKFKKIKNQRIWSLHHRQEFGRNSH